MNPTGAAIAQPIRLVRRAPPGRLQRWGDALRRHRRAVAAVQWLIVAVYAALVVLPVLLPEPPADATLWNNLRLFAQFAFWGIWWPFVILSVVLAGRAWCGLLCPEGTLTEFASRHGLGHSIPRWLRWGGWAPLAFAATTVWGQLVTVYEYPRATMLILGGSTIAAMLVGFVWGRGTRVWCRYLCPVSGVFALLARLAPLHYRSDAQAWRAWDGPRERVACAPLLDLRHLDSAAECHACGRCSGHRGAIALQARPAGQEIAQQRDDAPAPRAAAWLLLVGVLGVALGAFQWSANPWFTIWRQAAATWLLDHGPMALLSDSAPWWLLTHEPQAHDVFLWLDGLGIVAYIGAMALVMGGSSWLAVRAAAALLRLPAGGWSRLALALVPIGAASLFIGLSQTTLTQLRAEGLLPPGIGPARALLLAGACAWVAVLAWRLTAGRAPLARRLGATLLVTLPAAATTAAWALQFRWW